MCSPPLRSLLLALVAPLIGCADDAEVTPAIELYLDGTLAGPSPAIDFPQTLAGGEGIAAQLELKNLGPGALLLTGTPPLRLERDDRLAFRVTQPPTTRFEPGESLLASVVFAPHSPGSSVARLVIATSAADEPIVIALTGQGINVDRPVLSVTLDGAAPGETFDFGSVSTVTARTITLRLANSGSGVFELGPSPVTLSGPDASAFELTPPTVTALAAGEGVDVPLTFRPPGCRAYRASLAVAPSGPSSPLTIALTGRGGENPQGHADVTDTEQLPAPDLDVTLSGPSVGGKRRFAVGNLSVGSFAGQVALYAWDGCTLSQRRTISAASAGLTAQRFGAQVALSADGTTLLVTAYDHQKDAWLFAVGADDEPRFLATLSTFDEDDGHGRGAALSGDGTVAFIGQTMADSGFNPHGAVFVYERGEAGWQSMPEARWRLGPAAPTQVELIGAWVETSQDGAVVVSGALLTPAGAPTKGPATAFVWVAERDPDTDERAWGQPHSGGEPNHRVENVRLLSAQAPTDGAARVAISADGDTIALSTVVGTEVQIRLYVRDGDLWGLPTTSLDERMPTARLTLTASSALRMGLGPDGDFLLLANETGAREVARPADGWVDESPLASIARTWNVPFYGQLALTPDGLSFAGMDRAGSAWFVFR